MAAVRLRLTRWGFARQGLGHRLLALLGGGRGLGVLLGSIHAPHVVKA